MLNYKVEGVGQPLLLIHGFGISFHIWEELSPRLCNHFTLVQIELPGIGSSPPPLHGQGYIEASLAGMEQVRIALGIDHWHVLSYSSGTRVGEQYLNRHRAHIDRAIFVCPMQISPWKSICLRLAIRLDRFMPRLGTWVLSGSRLQYLIDLLGFNAGKNERSIRWFAEIRSQPVEILKETLRCLSDGRRPFTIPERPVLFIWANEDRIVDAPSPSTNDRVIRADHSAVQTAAESVAGFIRSFLADP